MASMIHYVGAAVFEFNTTAQVIVASFSSIVSQALVKSY